MCIGNDKVFLACLCIYLRIMGIKWLYYISLFVSFIRHMDEVGDTYDYYDARGVVAREMDMVLPLDRSNS